MNITEALRPLMKDQTGRIVNVSSRAGSTSIVPSKALLSRITSASSKEELGRLAEEFIESIREGRHSEEGWPSSMYGISKLLLSMYVRIEAKSMETRGIMVNACCPG
jgi:carbonyl reductase 1